MVGRLALNQKIGVRFPVPQPASAQYRGRPRSEVLSHFLQPVLGDQGPYLLWKSN